MSSITSFLPRKLVTQKVKVTHLLGDLYELSGDKKMCFDERFVKEEMRDE